MTKQELDVMKAAFAARGGEVTHAPEGVAYGVNAATDKAKRAEAREQREYERAERDSENYMQRVREERGYYRS